LGIRLAHGTAWSRSYTSRRDSKWGARGHLLKAPGHTHLPLGSWDGWSHDSFRLDRITGARPLGTFDAERGSRFYFLLCDTEFVHLEMAPVIMRRMTLMTATYELQERLKPEHFRALGEFSNTYGLQKFRYNEKKNLLHFDYDASRLTDNVVESVLRQARIPVLRRLEPTPQ